MELWGQEGIIDALPRRGYRDADIEKCLRGNFLRDRSGTNTILRAPSVRCLRQPDPVSTLGCPGPILAVTIPHDPGLARCHTLGKCSSSRMVRRVLENNPAKGGSGNLLP